MIDRSQPMPTRGPDGEQLAPETFVRWIWPGIWEDTEGDHHFDVAAILSHLGIPDTPENRALATRVLTQRLAMLLPPGAPLRVRP